MTGKQSIEIAPYILIYGLRPSVNRREQNGFLGSLQTIALTGYERAFYILLDTWVEKEAYAGIERGRIVVDRAQTPSIAPSALAALPVHPSIGRGADFAHIARFLSTGVAPLDAFVDGLALHRTHLLTGMYGNGTTSLLHTMLATITRSHPVLLLDPHARFHPPAAAAAGVHLPHLLWMRTDDQRHLRQLLGFALRGDAFPLIVWDVGALPDAALIDRIRPVVRRGRSALLLVTADGLAPGSVADGVTLGVAHDGWSHGRGTRRGCDGRALTVHVTDHQRGRTTSFPLRITFPQSLPSLLPFAHTGSMPDATTTRGGTLDTGVDPAMRSAG